MVDRETYGDEPFTFPPYSPKRVSDEETRFTGSFCTAFGLLGEGEASTLDKKAEAARSFLDQASRKGKKGARKKSASASDGDGGATEDGAAGGATNGGDDADADAAAADADGADGGEDGGGDAEAAATRDGDDADADASAAAAATSSDADATSDDFGIEITDEEMANGILAEWEGVQANGIFKVTGRTDYRVLRNISDIATDLVEVAKGGDDDDDDDDDSGEGKDEGAHGAADGTTADAVAAATGGGDAAAVTQDASGDVAEEDAAADDSGDVGAGGDADGPTEQKEASKSGADADDENFDGDEDESDAVPVDPNGTPCVEKLALPVETVEEMLETLRYALVDEAETTATAREKKMSTLFEERKGDLTFELEERLRTHWPRKGRTDVGFQQPRIGELIAHRQRHERQVRAVKLKLRAQDERYADLLEQTNASIKKYTGHMEALEESLIEQSNLASLQGVLKRAKETTAMYKTTCQDWSVVVLTCCRCLVRYSCPLPFAGSPNSASSWQTNRLTSLRRTRSLSTRVRPLRTVETTTRGRLESRAARWQRWTSASAASSRLGKTSTRMWPRPRRTRSPSSQRSRRATRSTSKTSLCARASAKSTALLGEMPRSGCEARCLFPKRRKSRSKESLSVSTCCARRAGERGLPWLAARTRTLLPPPFLPPRPRKTLRCESCGASSASAHSSSAVSGTSSSSRRMLVMSLTWWQSLQEIWER